jgi:hypothetical protein
MGGGPLTRIELAIVLVVVAILALIITSTLAARRIGNAQDPGRQQPIPVFALAPQAGGSQRFATSPIVGPGVSLPMVLPGGLSNPPGDSFIFSGITNSEPANWLRSLESGPTQNTGQ